MKHTLITLLFMMILNNGYSQIEYVGCSMDSVLVWIKNESPTIEKDGLFTSVKYDIDDRSVTLAFNSNLCTGALIRVPYERINKVISQLNDNFVKEDEFLWYSYEYRKTAISIRINTNDFFLISDLVE